MTASKSGKITTITITDINGTTTTEIRDGEDGSGSGDMLKATYDVNNNGIVDNAEKVNNHTVEKDVPANAVFTDTTYSEATTSQAGLMSSTDKSNLDSNTSARHTHSNKSTLDGISSSDISNWNGKQNATDNSLTTTNKTITPAINEVNSIAKGANQALSYANYQAMITAFNSLDDDEYNVGQNIYIVTTEVPDLWISSVESTSSTYTYVDDATFVNSLATNGYVQVGYYKLSMLETQKVDLTDYVTNTDYATSSTGGVIKTGASYGTTMATAGTLRAVVKSYEEYSSAGNSMFIGKGTLENAITGKGLVSNTDFANNTTAGVIRTSSNYGTTVSGSGVLNASTLSYESYGVANNTTFVGKGTLENVITGKGLVSNTDYASSSTAGVVKANAAFGTQMGNEGLLYGAIRTYEQYNSAGNNALISKGTLENVITGKSLETANNKVTSISSSSTDTQYPSAKCVYDYIDNKVAIFNWDGQSSQDNSDNIALFQQIYETQKQKTCFIVITNNRSLSVPSYTLTVPQNCISNASGQTEIKGELYTNGYNTTGGMTNRFMYVPRTTLTLNNGEVTSVTAINLMDSTIRYLDPTADTYGSNYTPLYDGSPATKKYVDDRDVYSTTEQVVGTWIDRKTYISSGITRFSNIFWRNREYYI